MSFHLFSFTCQICGGDFKLYTQRSRERGEKKLANGTTITSIKPTERLVLVEHRNNDKQRCLGSLKPPNKDQLANAILMIDSADSW
jgi:hypothetical protein